MLGTPHSQLLPPLPESASSPGTLLEASNAAAVTSALSDAATLGSTQEERPILHRTSRSAFESMSERTSDGTSDRTTRRTDSMLGVQASLPEQTQPRRTDAQPAAPEHQAAAVQVPAGTAAAHQQRTAHASRQADPGLRRQHQPPSPAQGSQPAELQAQQQPRAAPSQALQPLGHPGGREHGAVPAHGDAAGKQRGHDVSAAPQNGVVDHEPTGAPAMQVQAQATRKEEATLPSDYGANGLQTFQQMKRRLTAAYATLQQGADEASRPSGVAS